METTTQKKAPIPARNQANGRETAHEMSEIAEHMDGQGEVLCAVNGMRTQPYKQKYLRVFVIVIDEGLREENQKIEFSELGFHK